MQVVILGANGQLGSLLVNSAPNTVKVSAFSSSVLDITSHSSVARVLNKVKPDLVINAAAYTQVDKAESETEQALAVNHLGVVNLVENSSPPTPIIHVSTDFVFDGRADKPYLPEDSVNPIGAYGASKLEGEKALIAMAPERSWIVRTAWLYAAEGRNFFNTMLNLMASRDALNVVADQKGTPTSAHTLARVLWMFAQQRPACGIYHWTDQGEATWFDFAAEIQRQALASGMLERQIPLHPITTAEYPTPAKRPAYSVLDKAKTYEAIGFRGASWQDELRDVIRIKTELSTQGKTQ
jgi:dTDP-4-dehydrorhamnose reductase